MKSTVLRSLYTVTKPQFSPSSGFATVAPTSSQGLRVERSSGAVGAEIHGVDLRQLDDSSTHQIRQALLDNGVVFFRDQELTPQQFMDFSVRFGQPMEYPLVPGIEGYPKIVEVLKREDEKNNFGGIWHSDTLYLEQPPMATMLIARQVPPYGGDTLFANQVAAYNALSDGLKSVLDKLVAVNSSAKADVTKTREDRVKGSSQKPKDFTSYHPVVRTHPETGRKSLYVNTAHTEAFQGWSKEESAPLLDYLHRHQIRAEFTCRFRWEVGSLAFWDNRAVLHNPINDYHGFRRSMYRITLAGDTPK